MGLFGSSFKSRFNTNTANCLSSLQKLIPAVKQELKRMRSTLRTSLQQGGMFINVQSVINQADQIVKASNYLMALILVETCLVELITNASVLASASSKTPPEQLKDVAACIVFAAPRLVEDLPQLTTVANLLVPRFKGAFSKKEYTTRVVSPSTAAQYQVDSGLIKNLTPGPVPTKEAQAVINEVALRFNVPSSLLSFKPASNTSQQQPARPTTSSTHVVYKQKPPLEQDTIRPITQHVQQQAGEFRPPHQQYHAVVVLPPATPLLSHEVVHKKSVESRELHGLETDTVACWLQSCHLSDTSSGSSQLTDNGGPDGSMLSPTSGMEMHLHNLKHFNVAHHKRISAVEAYNGA